MSFEEIRVITVVYTAVLLPLIIYWKYKSRLPKWIPSFYIISLVVCSLGWELWFTYGWLDGDPVDLRRSENLNKWLPKDINWLLNSMGDNRVPKEFYSNDKEGAVYRWNGLKKVPWDMDGSWMVLARINDVKKELQTVAQHLSLIHI